MLVPTVHVHLAWRTGAIPDDALRARVGAEIQQLGWTLSQMETTLYDLHQSTGLSHAYLVPKLELRLPLYDLNKRLRIVLTYLDTSSIVLQDEDGRKLADVRLL